MLSLALALNLVLVLGDFAFVGDEAPPCMGGNSPSSSNKKHCFGGVSVATAISWNFSDSAKRKKEKICFVKLLYYSQVIRVFIHFIHFNKDKLKCISTQLLSFKIMIE